VRTVNSHYLGSTGRVHARIIAILRSVIPCTARTVNNIFRGQSDRAYWWYDKHDSVHARVLICVICEMKITKIRMPYRTIKLAVQLFVIL